MALKGRDLVTIDDLTNGEIEAIFKLADSMADSMPGQYGLCRGKVMASLFFEPSTRTRLSFETAMHRLGGRVISVSDPKSTSLAKGESIADMARIVAGYADIIVIRHPWEGAARLVADYADVPVINAGDGGHQHPTQTLCDLYTLIKERGSIHGLKIALWGDLKYGRTTHSLIFALAKFGATIVFCPSRGLEVPENILHKLVTEYGGELERFGGREKKVKSGALQVDAVYMTPGKPHQLAMMPGIDFEVELKAGVDALYVTRPQKERFTGEEQPDNEFPVVDKKMMRGKQFSKTLVMHPLPRVDELAYDLDADPRAMYFKQASRGVPVRMALLALTLGVKEFPVIEEPSPVRTDYLMYERDYGVKCNNPRCVTAQESEKKYLKPGFKIVNREPLTLRCVYCEHGTEPKFIASTEWHEGRVEHKKYHRANSHLVKKIRPENLIAFDSEKEAEEHGYKPGYYAKAKEK
ncbi:MAG: aspartate carbamoyltransferase [Dehalococcoidia bacterium]|nr:aspartate carbamoyltransferase [Dehalococcoidia bacterium]